MIPFPERIDFLDHLGRNRAFALSSHSQATKRPFIPDHVLHSYLYPVRIRELLRCYAQPEGDWEIVQQGYLKIFTILLVIDRAAYLQHFVEGFNLADTQLPFKHPTEFPSGCSDFYEAFYQAQWGFCALPLRRHWLNKTRWGDELIIPIVRRGFLKEGVDASTYIVEIEPSYNDLVAKVRILSGSRGGGTL
jgi:hypothetical protein